MASTSPIGLEEQAFLLLSQNYVLCKKLSDRELSMLGITLAEHTLLRIIENSPGITAGEARKRMFSSAPSLAQLVKSAEQKELMKRGSDSNDTRRQPMTLTKKGRDVVMNGRNAIQKALRNLDISPKVLHALIASHSSLSSSLSSYGR